MTIKKYYGKTKEEAIALAKNELGSDAEIMNIEEKKSGGFLGMGKKSSFEVTAMVDRDIDNSNGVNRRFEAVADQDIKVSYEDVKKENSDAQLEETKRQFAELSKIFRENENVVSTKKEVKENPLPNTEESQSIKKTVNETSSEEFIEKKKTPKKSNTNHKFVKTLYNTLLDNDVDEKYINQLLFDMEKVFRNGNNVNFLISNVYQKMILKMGQPSTISFAKKGPMVVFFIGSTGVGKTTTIAKLASEFKMEKKKKVAFITIDTYRLKATDQLGEYASIMKIPMSVIYEPEELSEKVSNLSDYDLILVDTSGFSHKNNEMRENVVKLINGLDDKFEKEVYLVLSATTKYRDLKEILDSYKEFTDFNMIFTKLDETTNFGNILNCRLYSGNSLSYVTNGQNVPNDIEVVDTQKLVKQLLGGN
ncbi:MAG TPA: flagellar biosynthesis protein FlhF [Lachnospiraceae bacterium]|nr:flagellar biosynthesis protein FlhF [Lachnospiraceae bacterium]